MSTSRSPQRPQASAKPKGKQIQRLADLDYVTIRKLANRLDVPGEKNWRKLIEAMPNCRYDAITVEKFGINASKLDGSPAYAMLSDMSNRGVSYNQLITALKKMQFDIALQEIGYRESVKITQQPEATPGVEGQQLTLECKATGVPAPNYLWFKSPKVPLPDQTSDTLLIPALSKEDAGKYICRVENEVNTIFSAWVEVKVQKPHILKNGSLPPGSRDITESLTIHLQSPGEMKLKVGEELQLFVEASCAAGGQLFYQWFCGGKKLGFGRSNELFVKTVGLEDQGTYSCQIRSEHGGSMLTNPTQVVVSDPNQPPPTASVHTQIPTPHSTTSQAILSPPYNSPPATHEQMMQLQQPPPPQQQPPQHVQIPPTGDYNTRLLAHSSSYPTGDPHAHVNSAPAYGNGQPPVAYGDMQPGPSQAQSPFDTHQFPPQFTHYMNGGGFAEPQAHMMYQSGATGEVFAPAAAGGMGGAGGGGGGGGLEPAMQHMNISYEGQHPQDAYDSRQRVYDNYSGPHDLYSGPQQQQQQQQQQQRTGQHLGAAGGGGGGGGGGGTSTRSPNGEGGQSAMETPQGQGAGGGGGVRDHLPCDANVPPAQPADLNDSCYDKVALLIGNKHYQRGELKLNTPENDAQDMAGVLLSAGFKVVSLVNLNKAEMEAAVRYFESLLGKNVYALFFFAGHGFELNSKNYMMPVDADVEKSPEQCLCAQQVLQTMQAKGAKLSIVLLDMCRVNASTVTLPTHMDLYPAPQGCNGYFVIGFSCSPMERAYEAGAGQELKEEDRDNSIFVSAFKRHLQSSSLRERLDTLLTDAAAGVRERGKAFNTHPNAWMKPEIRHNLGEKLSLADPIKNDYEPNSQRKERALLWQSAHIVPDSVVVTCPGDFQQNIRPAELSLRLHFEAEHSNVLIVTAELLNGCLTRCEVLAMDMFLQCDGNNGLSLKCHEDNKQYKYKESTQYAYGHDLADKEMDLMHFKIPDLQKITTKSVTLKVVVDYQVERRGRYRERKRCEIDHKMSPPPLYAKILSTVKETTSSSPYVQPYYHSPPY